MLIVSESRLEKLQQQKLSMKVQVNFKLGVNVEAQHYKSLSGRPRIPT